MNTIHDRLEALAFAQTVSIKNGEPFPGLHMDRRDLSTNLKTASTMRAFLEANQNLLNLDDIPKLEAIKDKFKTWMAHEKEPSEALALVEYIDTLLNKVIFILPPDLEFKSQARLAEAGDLHSNLIRRRHTFERKDVAYLNDLRNEFIDLSAGHVSNPEVQMLIVFLSNLINELSLKKDDDSDVLPDPKLENAGAVRRFYERRRSSLTGEDHSSITQLREAYLKIISALPQGTENAATGLITFLNQLLWEIHHREGVPEFTLENVPRILDYIETNWSRITHRELPLINEAKLQMIDLMGRAPDAMDMTDCIVMLERLDALIASLSRRRVENNDHDDDGDVLENVDEPRANQEGYRWIEQADVDSFNQFVTNKRTDITAANVLKLAVLADDYTRRDLTDECYGMINYFLDHYRCKELVSVCKQLLKKGGNVFILERRLHVEMNAFPGMLEAEELTRLDRLLDFTLKLNASHINASELERLRQRLFHTTIISK